MRRTDLIVAVDPASGPDPSELEDIVVMLVPESWDATRLVRVVGRTGNLVGGLVVVVTREEYPGTATPPDALPSSRLPLHQRDVVVHGRADRRTWTVDDRRASVDPHEMWSFDRCPRAGYR